MIPEANIGPIKNPIKAMKTMDSPGVIIQEKLI
jgi:hypothetical protein